ncbi:MAG: formate--tetrahydrofolate ligase [Candidatus Zixiibacteriota bacterium]
MRSDIDIAQSIDLKPIGEIAETIGISQDNIYPYGKHIAKVEFEQYEKMKDKPDGKLILVSAITPTPAGEGKTTTSIGLSMGLNRIGKKSIVTLREPSLGPLFGIKGGAAGGGMSQVLPMEDINMHFTGDIHAVTTAHNLITAVMDNHIHRHTPPMFDPRRIVWNRVMDMNDRSLRNIVIGLGGRANGTPRESHFAISASSEIMAILGLVDNYQQLKERLGKIRLGYTYDKEPVYLDDIGISGAVASVLKHALKPNLVQTTEHTPAFVHGGPFANIAQGTCTTLSMKMGLKMTDYVVTEAGFGFDLGAEKFFDIVSRKADLDPKVVVLVATVRALKMHGGMDKKELDSPNPEAVEKGLENLAKHLENIAKFNMPAVVAINKFHSDTDEEIKIVRDFCFSKGVKAAVSDVHAKGGLGAEELAQMVSEEADKDMRYKPLYDLDTSIEEKVQKVCSEIYGSKAVDCQKQAQKDIKIIKKLGLEHLPVCIAKTQKSLSDNPKLLGRPRDFLVTVREIQVSSGAGFLVPVTGDIMLMPGLSKRPSALDININDDGEISGLF